MGVNNWPRVVSWQQTGRELNPRPYDCESNALKVKGAYSSLCENHHRATKRHLPYGITQCYLPPKTGECTLP